MKFWICYWCFWLLMLVVGDPIAVYLGKKDKVGDTFTLTHFLVVVLGTPVIAAVIVWLSIHFLIVHRRG
jgi:Na+-driven multidrug efflux pump